eukprot:634416-Prymnesium_polylepis.2
MTATLPLIRPASWGVGSSPLSARWAAGLTSRDVGQAGLATTSMLPLDLASCPLSQPFDNVFHHGDQLTVTRMGVHDDKILVHVKHLQACQVEPGPSHLCLKPGDERPRLHAIEAAASNIDDHDRNLLARSLEQLNQAPWAREHALRGEKDDGITFVDALADQVAQVAQSA